MCILCVVKIRLNIFISSVIISLWLKLSKFDKVGMFERLEGNMWNLSQGSVCVCYVRGGNKLWGLGKQWAQ
jgi:hypothetical protein